ncbi:MAG: YggS family pyridoxal phosphate-dependent enzyme [Bacilli bacterium]
MIYENYDRIKKTIGEVNLLVVSKHQSEDKIIELYNHGIREFGENRTEELKVKKNNLPNDIKWHFIGRIQSKKIRDIVKCAALIHSVDSLKALRLINKEANKINKVQEILIQLNISHEESKTGFNRQDVETILLESKQLANVKVLGLMTMAPNTNDKAVLENVFKQMKECYDFYDFSILSMGMSNDYKIAIEYGSNLIRVGTMIFKGA